MESSNRYRVVFDATVLVPGFLANFLLWLGQSDLFQAHWSADIHAEWIRNRKKKYNIDIAKSEARRDVMDMEFPNALVRGYEGLLDSLYVDEKDRHVLAAAITCGADAIVTTNIKHFPKKELDKYNIAAIHQDNFVLDQLYLFPDSSRLVAMAVVAHKKSLRKTRTTWMQYFESMSRCKFQSYLSHKFQN